MKCFKVVDGELYAVSLVEDPAIESTFIALSKNKVEIKLENEKRIITGAALIPNKPIYRNIGGKEFYISFDEETIEKLAQGYLDNVHTVTADHNNDEIWQKIKDGIYKGFSIEAIVGLDEMLLSKDYMDQELINKLRELLYEVLGKQKTEEVVEDVIEENVCLESEETTKLKEDITNLTAEVERLKGERDDLESRLNDITAERDKLMKEKEELNAENIKLSKQPSVEPNKTTKINEGKNYKAAVSFMLK